MPSYSAFAFQLIESSGEAITVDLHYDSSADVYDVNFKSGTVRWADFTRYTDDTFTEIHNQRIYNAVDEGGSYYTNFVFRCNQAYYVKFYDYADFHVATVKFVGSEIKNPSAYCEGDPPPPDTNPQPSEGEKCASAVCECIAQLKAVNQQIQSQVSAQTPILSSMDGKLDKLNPISDSVASMDGKLDALEPIKDAVQGIEDQLTTDEDFSLPDVSAPSPEPYTPPDQPQEKFTDDTQYFSDAGSADIPSSLPPAPDVAECWEGICAEDGLTPEGVIGQEAEFTKEQEMQKESELNKDAQLQKDMPLMPDMFLQDETMTQDQFTKDEPMQKDAPMPADQMQPDAPMQKEAPMPIQQMQPDAPMQFDVFDVDQQFTNTNQFEKTNQMQQTPIDYPLNWSQ